MKTICLILLLLLNMSYTFAQATQGISHSFTLSSKSVVYDRATGEQISREKLEVLLRKPESAFHKFFDERGNITHFEYDATISAREIQFYNPAERAKPGTDFPPFVMTTLDKKELSSEGMKGNILVLNFQLMLQGPLFKYEKIKAFEEILDNLKTPVKAIYITSSSSADTRKALQNISLNYPIVTDAHNFREKYKVANVQTFIVIDAAGKLVGYADNDDELKQLLALAGK